MKQEPLCDITMVTSLVWLHQKKLVSAIKYLFYSADKFVHLQILHRQIVDSFCYAINFWKCVDTLYSFDGQTSFRTLGPRQSLLNFTFFFCLLFYWSYFMHKFIVLFLKRNKKKMIVLIFFFSSYLFISPVKKLY